MSPVELRPDKLAREMAEFSRKLGRGMENLLNADKIDTGVTPKETVYSEDKLTLYRYLAPEGVVRNSVPVLIVYALVNRPYMTDIQENRSTIKNLLAAGQDVYLIDWGYPDGADSSLALDDYINGYIDRCVDVIREQHGLQKINLLGICQGGAFSLCYTALHPDKVQNLVTMVTPVDFQTPDNLLSAWVQQMDVDLLVDTLGDVAGHQVAQVLRNGFAWSRQAAQSLTRQLEEFIHEEARLSPPRLELEDFYSDVRQLDQRVERLQKRAQRLRDQIKSFKA